MLDTVVKALLTAIVTALMTSYITTVRLDERVASLTYRIGQCEQNIATHMTAARDIYQRLSTCEARIGYVGERK
jgi:hypothetical protein